MVRGYVKTKGVERQGAMLRKKVLKGAFGSFFVLFFYPLGKQIVLGVNIVVWRLRWGSPGSQIADTWSLAVGKVG